MERREKTSTRWLRVTKKLVSDNRLRATNLKENSEQEFRVYAENKAGVGPASETSGYVLLKDPIYPPEAPGQPRVTDTTKSSITLSWTRPMYDGGADILGYSVDYAEDQESIAHDDSEIQWKQAAGKSDIRTTAYTVGGLLSGKKYRFRVKAHNAVGPSEPAVCLSVVSPVDRMEAPGIHPDAELPRNLTVRAGGSIR